jgi:hypothetical protein
MIRGMEIMVIFSAKDADSCRQDSTELLLNCPEETL